MSYGLKRAKLIRHLEAVYFDSQDWKEDTDGYPLTLTILKRSKEFIYSLPNHLLDMFTEDTIFGDPNGTMSFEVDSKDGSTVLFSLDIGNTKAAYYVENDERTAYFNEFTDTSSLNPKLKETLGDTYSKLQ